MTLSQELAERGFIHQFTAEHLTDILDGPKRTVYHGIDPTADSAHAGNFANWVLLRHLVQAGHQVIFLVGGGTGRIGDPKPDAERVLADPAEIDARVEKLKSQAQKLLGSNDIQFVNNQDWLGELHLIEFLRDIGKHFTINELLKKDAIATRLASEVGLSYTEFAYPLLQAYDYLQLHRQYGCDLQVGGSDQWGNIVAGVDLIRRLEQTTVYAITQPLVIDKATGKKFGKSEGNAVWLDAEKTSPYQFYQFWFNTSDESVVDFLKRFTFLPLDEIAHIGQEFEQNPGARNAQRILALEVTSFVHGKAAAESAAHAAAALFGDVPFTDLSESEIATLIANTPHCEVKPGTALIDVLVAAELASSKREARTFLESGAISVNGEKITDVAACMSGERSYYLVRRGKKQQVIVQVG